jgi:murein L,D-transpeptidase YafK
MMRRFLKGCTVHPKTMVWRWFLTLFMLGLPWVSAPAAPSQMREPVRVTQARAHRGQAVAQLLAARKITPGKLELFLRAFKKQAVLEVWGRNHGDRRFVLIKAYPVCAASGVPGPKRQQGDGQVPEGFYVIDRFNPYSNFHLSLGLNYPNRQDRQRAAAAKISNPGGDIFIHGNCVSIGCMAMGDQAIEEIYLLALAARAAADRRGNAIPVHVFPARLDAAGFAALEKTAPAPSTLTLWRELRPAYENFERTHDLPAYSF